MSRTLSGSTKNELFCEYLKINGKEQPEIHESVAEIDKICTFIADRYSGANNKNAFEILQKLAVEGHTFEQFLESIRPAVNSVGCNAHKASVLFYNFFADTKSVEESFASYMVGRYRLGYPYLALYWAAILFERIITNKWKLQNTNWYRKNYDPDKENTLKYKIEKLTDETLENDSVYLRSDVFIKFIFKTVRGQLIFPDLSPNAETQEDPALMSLTRVERTRMRLTNFRILRNRVMHELNPDMKEEMPNNHLEFITYVWLELLPKSFEQQREKYPDILPQQTINTLFNTSADYMIRAVDETTKKEVVATDYSAIKYADFDNLYTLRDRLLPLRERLNVWLTENSIDLLTDILTPIDTTSAYIWMPMVSREKKIGKIAGVYNAAVSILATPLDLRVYLDFGGYAQTDRFSYYQFLESPEYTTFVEAFVGKKEMKVFDIDWYCFISNQPVPLPQWNRDRRTLIESAKHKLIDADIPITWNRMLHGYILEKDIVDEDGITFEWIEQRLKWIIQFYQAYIAFKPPMTFETYKMTRKDKLQ